MAEDEQIVEHYVHACCRQVNPHDRPRLSTTGKEPGQGGGGDREHRAVAENAEVDYLQLSDRSRMADPAKESGRNGNQR